MTPDDIAAALETIPAVFRDSPQFVSHALDGRELLLKVETINPLASFKGRGPATLMAAHDPRVPLVCASAGNFGQGLAYAARAAGGSLTVFASIHANPGKLERMRALGAEVSQIGSDFDEAKDAALEFAFASGARHVIDGHDPEIAAGAGTIALELLRDADATPEALLIPVGNGALAWGIGTWMRAHAPATRLIGVVAAGAPAMARSFERGEPVTTDSADTIADGIAVRVPVPNAVAALARCLDEYVEVSDEQLVDAIRWSMVHLGILLEPAAAAGLAAARALGDGAPQRVGTVLTGANATPEQLAAWWS